MVSTLHTLIRIMLKDELGNDAVMRAISKDIIFKCLLTILNDSSAYL